MTQPNGGIGEAVLLSLRSLYGQHGYSLYKMNKFEEYDLYARNKDFLISEGVITFTDGNGKLLALKPDVTLSIVKNSKDDTERLQKLFYQENVYRVSKGSRNFKEIMQVGLECIGKVDAFCVCEVLELALRSLDAISPRNVLSVSHLGVLSDVLASVGVPDEKHAEVLHCIGEKNPHELSAILRSVGVTEENEEFLRRLTSLRGKTADVLPEIARLLAGKVGEKTLAGFTDVLSALADEDRLEIDFSVVGDLHYYNGFVFKGFVEGIPTGVLSGGQYDMLMRRMGRRSLAIGFAVYLDTVEQYFRTSAEYDVDVVLLYDGTSSLGQIRAAVARLSADGASVLADTAVPEKTKYKKLIVMKNGKTEAADENA